MHPSDINIGQSEYSVYELCEMIKGGKIVLEESPWNNNQKSFSIESVFLALTMTPIYVDATNPNKWIIIDGKKRLNAIYSFFSGDFALSSLEFFVDMEGCKVNSLPKVFERKFFEAVFTVYSINQGVPENVKQSIIKRILPDTNNL